LDTITAVFALRYERGEIGHAASIHEKNSLLDIPRSRVRGDALGFQRALKVGDRVGAAAVGADIPARVGLVPSAPILFRTTCR
jgi:hypothetical protein